MTPSKCKIFKEQPDVNSRLEQLQLDPKKLRAIRDRGLMAASYNDTLDDAPSSAGQAMYAECIKALRELLCTPETSWEKYEIRNVCMIANEALQLRIAYSTVDIACNDGKTPSAITDRGPVFSQMFVGPDLFDQYPEHSLKNFTDNHYKTAVLMIDKNGAVELSFPIIENKNYVAFWERIYLSDGSDFDIFDRLDDSGDDDGYVNPEFSVPRR